jgi:hypothetical protein
MAFRLFRSSRRSRLGSVLALPALLLALGCERPTVRFGEDETEREIRTPVRSESREEAREKEERGKPAEVQGPWR